MPPALSQPWQKNRSQGYKGLTKPQCSILIQLRSGVTGIASCLYRLKVPNFDSPDCSCGRGVETVKHLLIDCLKYSQKRQLLAKETGTTNILDWFEKNPKVLSRWAISNLDLHQFKWTRENYEIVFNSDEKEDRGD